MWHPWGGHDNRRNSFWSCVIASYEDPVSTTAVCAFLPLPHHSRILTWSPSTTISIMSINHNDVAGRKYWVDDGTLLVRVQQAAYKPNSRSIGPISRDLLTPLHDPSHPWTGQEKDWKRGSGPQTSTLCPTREDHCSTLRNCALHAR